MDIEKHHASSLCATSRNGQVEQPLETRLDKITSVDADEDHGEHDEEPAELIQRNGTARYAGGSAPTRKKSRASSFSSMMESTRPIPATAPLDATDLTAPCHLTTSRTTIGPDANEAGPSATPLPLIRTDSLAPQTARLLPVCSNHGEAYAYHEPATPAPSIHRTILRKRIIAWIPTFLKGLLAPVPISIILALPCSLVLPLKALFVSDVAGWSGTRIPYAPNGGPALGFLLDTTIFLGGMSVPTSLILLGASFARLRVSLVTSLKDVADPSFLTATGEMERFAYPSDSHHGVYQE